MTATKRLCLSDVRNVFRLIGEVRELGNDPKAWRPHMVMQLRKLFTANIVISSEVHAQASKSPDRLRIVDIGWGCDADDRTWEIRATREDENLQTWMLSIGQTPAENPEGVDLPVKPIKPVYGGKSFVLSQYTLSHINAVDQLGLHRAFGDKPFSSAEHRLFRLFHIELGRLWKRDMLKAARNPSLDLPPRLSQTLAELLSGQSEKEIAARLDLSRHTIHNYVKALHQRFQVSSRGELLAKASEANRPDFVPKLSLNLQRKEKPEREPAED